MRVLRAEAHFLETVLERHPHAEGKPAVIGNCQAGWALMMLAAAYPDLAGEVRVTAPSVDLARGIFPIVNVCTEAGIVRATDDEVRASYERQRG